MSALSEKWLFNFRIFSGGYPDPKAEVRFHVTRKYTLDYAFLDKMIAVEVEGGQFGVKCRKCGGTGLAKYGRAFAYKCTSCRGTGKVSGGHQSQAGLARDCEKYNLAQSMGWKVFRFSTSMIEQRKYYLPLFRVLGISEKEKA